MIKFNSNPQGAYSLQGETQRTLLEKGNCSCESRSNLRWPEHSEKFSEVKNVKAADRSPPVCY